MTVVKICAGKLATGMADEVGDGGEMIHIFLEFVDTIIGAFDTIAPLLF